MSYLKLPNGIPDFSKAVFSLWFRVPRESVIAASEHSLPTDDENFPMMQKILPLLTYGSIQTNANYQFIIDPDIIGPYPGEGTPPTLAQPVGWEAHTPYEVDPCLIGLHCYSDGTFDMVFNIQTGDHGSYDSLQWFATSLDYVAGAQDQMLTPGTGFVGQAFGPDTGYGLKSTIADGTYGIQDAQNENFNVITDISLEPDTWHHVLLSFDVSGDLTIGPKPSSDCRLWYAIDDVDYRGWENLGPFRAEDDGLGENTIVTQQVDHQSYFDDSKQPLFFNNYVPLPSGNYSPGLIPASGEELGLPAASHYVDAIFRVEMAELQIFTGVTLDTGDASNRAAFVKDGKPVDPTGTAASAILGKKPDVLLHGNTNWQDGDNTGTLGVTIADDGTMTKLPGGQFTPVAGIEKFKPEPALEETTA
jgi:hypothetical protein